MFYHKKNVIKKTKRNFKVFILKYAKNNYFEIMNDVKYISSLKLIFLFNLIESNLNQIN